MDTAYCSLMLVFMEQASLKSRLEYKWPDATFLQASGRISAKRSRSGVNVSYSALAGMFHVTYGFAPPPPDVVCSVYSNLSFAKFKVTCST